MTCPECSGGWISVEERLPDLDEWVIICGTVFGQHGPVVCEGKVTVSRVGVTRGRYFSVEVEYWQPLPTPPEKP